MLLASLGKVGVGLAVGCGTQPQQAGMRRHAELRGGLSPGSQPFEWGCFLRYPEGMGDLFRVLCLLWTLQPCEGSWASVGSVAG